MTARLDNRSARRLFLDRHALLEPPSGPATGAHLIDLVERLGFVQLDSVTTVARAHHMILHSRRSTYRPPALTRALNVDRTIFEHWTHDAAAIPMSQLPFWSLKFARDRARLERRWPDWHGAAFHDRTRPVLDHIRANGPCRSDAFADGHKKTSGWWDWHPSKTALEFLWRSGALAIAAREGFRKVYDLAGNVYPDRPGLPPEVCIDWFMSGALDRLGFGSPGELADFWDVVTRDEARAWCDRALADGRVVPIEIEGADGGLFWRLARPGTIAAAQALGPAPGMVRVLSPFDPALRDRGRAERLFGFAYRIEIFVPAPQRKYGYYVFPLLEGERLIGRIDMRVDREAGALRVAALWPEAGVALGSGRMQRIEAALARTGRLAGMDRVAWSDGWRRQTMP